MGLKISGRSISFLFLVTVMNILFIEDLGGDCASINDKYISCNGTFGDCFLGNEDDEVGEFPTYSVGGRWLLQAQSGNHISYGVLQPPPVCGTAQYSNCIVQVNAQNRPCTDYNRCKRVG